ncbi:MAG: acetyl-CoA acetyltransferase [Deltaproteobacteria bacterium]|nr:acetyl-CoA acetyltransferase [Deltaproteobacteria bacterium]MBW2363026.1 acetyl-CoA acetyltransferase [Deltaproteobacteria bacterium]
MAARDPVIVGIGLSDYPKAPHLSTLEHHAQALQRALADSGVQKGDIDGFLCAGVSGTSDDAVMAAEYLGIRHRYIDSTMTGGAAFEFHVQHAAAALRDGLCEMVLVSYGSDFLSRMGRTLGTASFGSSRRVSGGAMWEAPYGLPLVGSYAMVAQRHIFEFGTTSEQLAEIAVGVREYAGLNPLAMYRDPLSVDDVLSSRMIADPLHKLDCCVVSDGGGAVLMTTEERARDLPQPGVRVLGAAGGQTHWNISQMGDFTRSAAQQCAPEAFGRAGVTPADIDTIQFYDSFTITVLVMLEDCGFCAKGEGGPFVAEGHLKRGGRLPMNTDGGGLSASHSGMRGIFLLIEAVRQLRGQGGEAQVPNCELALCAGSGGYLSCIGTVILGRG